MLGPGQKSKEPSSCRILGSATCGNAVGWRDSNPRPFRPERAPARASAVDSCFRTEEHGEHNGGTAGVAREAAAWPRRTQRCLGQPLFTFDGGSSYEWSFAKSRFVPVRHRAADIGLHDARRPRGPAHPAERTDGSLRQPKSDRGRVAASAIGALATNIGAVSLDAAMRRSPIVGCRSRRSSTATTPHRPRRARLKITMEAPLPSWA